MSHTEDERSLPVYFRAAEPPASTCLQTRTHMSHTSDERKRCLLYEHIYKCNM
jgi:hypothetical protein